MRLDEQLRNYGLALEERAVPVSPEEATSRSAALVVPRSDSSSTRRWVAVAAVVVILAGGIGLATIAVTDEPSPDAPIGPATPETRPTTIAEPDTTPPTTSPLVIELLGPEAAGIGEIVTLDDGGLARINSVVVDAPIRNVSDRPSRDAPSITEVEVERCLGEVPPVSPDPPTYEPANWMSAQQWTGVLDDGTEVESRPAYHPPVVAGRGACLRGYVAVPLPHGATLVGMTLSSRSPSDEAEATWDFASKQQVDGPLRPPSPPAAVPIAEPIDVGISSFEATVLDVIENPTPRPSVWDLALGVAPEPPAAGRKLVEIRAEVCTARSRPELPPDQAYAGPSELQWLIVTEDNYLGNGNGESFNGMDPQGDPDPIDPFVGFASSLVFDDFPSGIPTGERPAPGECLTGSVQIDLPDGAIPAEVIVASEGGGWEYLELGRIRLDAGSTSPSGSFGLMRRCDDVSTVRELIGVPVAPATFYDASDHFAECVWQDAAPGSTVLQVVTSRRSPGGVRGSDVVSRVAMTCGAVDCGEPGKYLELGGKDEVAHAFAGVATMAGITNWGSPDAPDLELYAVVLHDDVSCEIQFTTPSTSDRFDAEIVGAIVDLVDHFCDYRFDVEVASVPGRD